MNDSKDEQLSKKFSDAAKILQSPSGHLGKLSAVTLWLSGAIIDAQDNGFSEEDIAPGTLLLKALEDLRYGTTSRLLRPPKKLKVGGQGNPPSEIAIQAYAIVAAEKLAEGPRSKSNAIELVEAAVSSRTGWLDNLGKKMRRERKKCAENRKLYVKLIDAYEEERLLFSTLVNKRDQDIVILDNLRKMSKSLNYQKSAT